MGLFGSNNNHDKLYSKGWEIYKKEYFCIDRRIYERLESYLKEYLTEEERYYQLGIFNTTNTMLTYTGLYLSNDCIGAITKRIEEEHKYLRKGHV